MVVTGADVVDFRVGVAIFFVDRATEHVRVLGGRGADFEDDALVVDANDECVVGDGSGVVYGVCRCGDLLVVWVCWGSVECEGLHGAVFLLFR